MSGESLKLRSEDLCEAAESLLCATADARRCGTHESRYVVPAEHYLRRAIEDVRRELRSLRESAA